MSADGVRIDLIHLDGAAVLAVRGEIDMASANSLSAALVDAGKLSRQVVLDFAGVTFMDSSGLNALLAFAAPRPREPPALTIRNAPAHVRRVLHITDLEWLLADGQTEPSSQV